MRTVGLPAQIFLFGCALVFGATRVGGWENNHDLWQVMGM